MKMLCWQLASLIMAHNLEMAVALSGSIVYCGELVASSPKKTLESTCEAPCSCLSLRLTTEIQSPILSVPIFHLARISPSVGKAWSLFLPNKRSCRVKY